MPWAALPRVGPTRRRALPLVPGDENGAPALTAVSSPSSDLQPAVLGYPRTPEAGELTYRSLPGSTAVGKCVSGQPRWCLDSWRKCPTAPVQHPGTHLPVLPQPRELRKSTGRARHLRRLSLSTPRELGSRFPAAVRRRGEQGSPFPSGASFQPSWQGGRTQSPPRVAAWRPRSLGISSSPT